jgi:hypothetical protein
MDRAGLRLISRLASVGAGENVDRPGGLCYARLNEALRQTLRVRTVEHLR